MARRRALVVAGIAFLAGAGLSLSALPDAVRLQRPAYLLIHLVLLGPTTALTNALRFSVTAGLLGRHVRLGTALRISIVASAANMLPLPGAVLVRIEALKQLGEGYRDAAASSAIVASVAITLNAGAAGALQGIVGVPAAGSLLLALAVGACVAALLLTRAHVVPGRRAIALGRSAAVELAALSVAASRLLLVLWGFGIDAGFDQAVVLTLAALGASAVGVFPDGLGLREAMAAGLAPLVGLPPSVGFLAAAVDRVVVMASVAPFAFLLARQSGARRGDGSGARPGPA